MTRRPLSAADRGEGPYLWRFTPLQRTLHALVIVSFFGLVLTGLPLHFAHAGWARVLIRVEGGIEAAGLLHRLCAIITFGYFTTHLVSLALRLRRPEDRKKLLWGPDSMVPQPKDFRDIIQMFRWFLGRGPRPQFDRFSYMEKFDYLAVFWGVAIIGASGLLLWLPEFFSKFLPGWVFNVATIIITVTLVPFADDVGVQPTGDRRNRRGLERAGGHHHPVRLVAAVVELHHVRAARPADRAHRAVQLDGQVVVPGVLGQVGDDGDVRGRRRQHADVARMRAVMDALVGPGFVADGRGGFEVDDAHGRSALVQDRQRFAPTHRGSWTAGHNYTMGATRFNEVRLGYMRRRWQSQHPSQNGNWARQIGIPDKGLPQFGWAFPRFNIDNVEALGPATGSVNIDQVEENYQLTENYTFIRGAHTFKAGYLRASDEEWKKLGVGLDYSLSKRTIVYTDAAKISGDGATDDAKKARFDVGIWHKF